MKKYASAILIFTLTFFNDASANDYYNYLSSDNVAIVQPQKNNAETVNPNGIANPTDNTNPYVKNLEITEESYKGTVDIPHEVIISSESNYVNTNANIPTKTSITTPTSTNTQKVKDTRSFSEKHPILSGLGTALAVTAVVGTVVVAGVAEAKAEENYRNNHRPHHHHIKQEPSYPNYYKEIYCNSNNTSTSCK